jgi:hypothetical protein
MTIGKYGYDPSQGPNPDFVELMKCHQVICEKFEREPGDVSVSMGMSDDFEQAVSIYAAVRRQVNEISETNIPDDWSRIYNKRFLFCLFTQEMKKNQFFALLPVCDYCNCR